MGQIMNIERILIGSCIIDPNLIDIAIKDGLSDNAFTTADRKNIWLAMLQNRTEGKSVDTTAIYLAMGSSCPMQEIIECERSAPTSGNGKKSLKVCIEAAILRQVKPAIDDISSKIDDGETPYDEIKSEVENLQNLMQPTDSQDESLVDILDSALSYVTNQLCSKTSKDDLILTGIESFDSKAGGIQSHEYVVLGARTSIGKSSFINQIAGHNIKRGKKVAIFTLETSSKAVVLQIASQRVGINLRKLDEEPEDKITKLRSALTMLKEKSILVFDRDMTLARIEARCRLLATFFKPDLVIIDYLGLIKVKGTSAYERMTELSKSMIPLRKTVNCALIVAAQLNRGNEKENRPPSRTDFRDTGSIEEDAHRIIALDRPKNHPISGIEQDINNNYFWTDIYQLKMRDGNLAHTSCSYNARHTVFEELQN
jgi:replicative DNA helicase